MNSIKATLKNLWKGSVPLAHAFWLYYFAGVVVLRFVESAIGPIFGIVVVAWAGFMVLPIWRSSNKYNGNQLFALLAKISAIITSLGLIGWFLA